MGWKVVMLGSRLKEVHIRLGESRHRQDLFTWAVEVRLEHTGTVQVTAYWLVFGKGMSVGKGGVNVRR